MEHEALAVVPNPPELWPRPDFGDVAAIPPMATLQIAIEAAVLPNTFEIDEQTPHSRLEALIEQAEAVVERYPALDAEKAQILEVIIAVAERVRVSIPDDPKEERRLAQSFGPATG